MSDRMTDSELAAKAIATWGPTAQLDMVIEELGELIVALQHLKRGRVTGDAVGEEMADVRIMLDQLEAFLPQVNHEGWLADKRARLRAKLERR